MGRESHRHFLMRKYGYLRDWTSRAYSHSIEWMQTRFTDRDLPVPAGFYVFGKESAVGDSNIITTYYMIGDAARGVCSPMS